MPRDWEREIRQLNNSDRSSRLNALHVLKRKVDSTPLPCTDPYNVAEALVETLVSDAVESCRELALSILVDAVSGLGAKESLVLAHCFIPAASQRFGSPPDKEPVEELRLKLIEACNALIVKCASELSEQDNKLVQRLVSCLIPALADTFPEVKRAAGVAISSVCHIAPSIIQVQFADLTKELASNLQHQHAKTRTVILNTIVDVTRASIVTDVFAHVFRQIVLPALWKVCTDRSTAVRVHLAQSLGVWLLTAFVGDCAEKRLPITFEADLLALLLDVVADETFNVAVRAVVELNAVGLHWQKTTLKLTSWWIPDISLQCAPTDVPHDEVTSNAACAVSKAAARLVVLYFPYILDIQVARWNLGKSQGTRSTRALAVLTLISRIAVNILPARIPGVIMMYRKCLCADDKHMQDGGYAAINALGATLRDYAPVFDTLAWLQCTERSSTGSEEVARRSSIIGVLSALLGDCGLSTIFKC